MLKEKNCENCTHFFQTGMAKYMSDGESGYCLLIQNDKQQQKLTESGIVKANLNAIKRIFDTCASFELFYKKN